MDDQIRAGLRLLRASHGSTLNRSELLELSELCQTWAKIKSFELILSGCNTPVELDASLGLTLEQHWNNVMTQIEQKDPIVYGQRRYYIESWFKTVYDLKKPVKFCSVWAVRNTDEIFRNETPETTPVEPYTLKDFSYVPQPGRSKYRREQILVMSNTSKG